MKHFTKFFMVGLLAHFLFNVANAQIHSTLAGGNWGDASSWVGGAIPDAADDVVINGTIDCNSNPSCNNILITSTGTIRNDYYSGSLTINGNITNNGSVQNYSYGFTLYIKGDIVNNGNWSNYYTRPNGTGDQTVTCLNGNYFTGNQFVNEKTSGNLYFNGTVNFENCDVYLNNADVYLQANSTLNLHNGQFRNCNLLGSGNSSVVYAEGVYNVDATTIQYVSFNNLSLDGDITLYTGCSMHGTVTNNGSLQNDYFSTSTALYDDFINNGTITDYSSGLTLEIYGNFTNNNVVDNYYLNFRSDVDQQISLMAGKTLSPNYFQSLKPTGSIIALTDLHFTDATIDLNYDSLFMQNNGTLTISNSHFTEGKVQALNAKSGYFTYNCENNSSTDYMTLTNATLTGEFQCGSYVSFRGTTTNNGLFHNDYYNAIPELYDLFINNGTIQNESGGLTLKIFGDFTNNNIIENSAMEFYSETDQYITLAGGKQFMPTYFTSLKPLGKIIATTDLYFNNTVVDLNYDTLLLQNNGKLSLDDGYLSECYLLSTDTKGGNLQLWMDNDANIDYCEVTNPEILGTTKIGPNNSFLGEILVTDTLQNDYYNYTLNIEGNITNNGVIRNQAAGSASLRLDITGNIINNGIWQQSYTYLDGSSDQHVTCLNSSAFSGWRFYVTNTAGLIYFDDEVRFENTEIKFEGNNLELPLNSLLYVHDGFLENCNLHGNGETSVLHGAGVYATDGPTILTSTIEDIKLTGDWGLAQSLIFNGTIINDGILQNDYYSYDVVVNADFTNNGTIKNHSAGLTMKMYGNFTNNGVWGAHAIDLYGIGDQEISLTKGLVFNPTYFTSFKPSGNIVSLTDLSFTDTYINLQNDSLVMPEGSLLSLSNRYLQNAYVSAPAGRFSLFMENEAYLWSCIFRDADLYGTLDLEDNDFYGTTINYGIMQNDYYSYTANFYGHLINNGTIQHNSGSFYINAHADITNNGTWTNYYTTMVGSTDQYIHLKDGHWINGQMRILSDVQNGTYQWFWNTWPIQSLFPDPDPFSGYTNAELQFNTAVSSAWLGTFKCWSNDSYSRNIIVDEIFSKELDLTVFLEGPYNSGTNLMETSLNTQANIPLDQPYNPSLPYYNESDPVWRYTGLESVATLPTGAVDWVVVELRDASTPANATSATTIYKTAAFLMEDGAVVDLDGSSLLRFDPIQSQNLYCVIYHRNHLGVISANGLSESSGIYSYDFSTGASQAYGGINGHKQLETGVWGMVAGDGNGNGLIQNTDETAVWKSDLGQSGYKGGDFNMNGLVQNTDETNYWKVNLGAGGQTPGKSSQAAYKSYVPE
ncbi:MAG: hypothetical protein KQI35_05670 [Bacteroidetes bacterium]|nr:hypothetical protein [Bacteroidota bacterium]